MLIVICLILISQAASAGTANREGNMNLTTVLRSDGPSKELGDASGVYGWLIGSWDVRVIDYEDGSKQERQGEWHFGWILEGRAIQDVFVVPARRLRSAFNPIEGNRYGTTLRIYDRKTDAWRVIWNNPVTGVENRLIGKKVGNEIIQEGVEKDGSLIRWSFRDIHADSFHWTGEESHDQGKTWTLSVEFFCVRKND